MIVKYSQTGKNVVKTFGFTPDHSMSYTWLFSIILIMHRGYNRLNWGNPKFGKNWQQKSFTIFIECFY